MKESTIIIILMVVLTVFCGVSLYTDIQIDNRIQEKNTRIEELENTVKLLIKQNEIQNQKQIDALMQRMKTIDKWDNYL